MDLVERAKRMVLAPREAWPLIAAEPHTVQELYTGYVMILAAIPPLAWFVGFSLVGGGILGGARVPITAGIAHVILEYALSLALVHVVALAIDALAPHFGGERSFIQALKLAAFAPTAMWLAGAFAVLPVLSILSLAGLYSLYALFVGLPVLMRTPEDKTAPYAVVVLAIALVLAVLVYGLAGLVIPGPMRGY